MLTSWLRIYSGFLHFYPLFIASCFNIWLFICSVSCVSRNVAQSMCCWKKKLVNIVEEETPGYPCRYFISLSPPENKAPKWRISGGTGVDRHAYILCRIPIKYACLNCCPFTFDRIKSSRSLVFTGTCWLLECFSYCWPRSRDLSCYEASLW